VGVGSLLRVGLLVAFVFTGRSSKAADVAGMPERIVPMPVAGD